jgi:carbonic anhydrase
MTTTQSLVLTLASFIWVSCQQVDTKKNAHGSDTAYVQSQHSESYTAKNLTPEEVLAKLKEGNRNFVKRLAPSNLAHDSSYSYFEQIAHTGKEQHPIACILTCMDSRVPPEIIFDQGIGSLFVVRVAGNIEEPDVLGSMEYAVAEKLWCYSCRV